MAPGDLDFGGWIGAKPSVSWSLCHLQPAAQRMARQSPRLPRDQSAPWADHRQSADLLQSRQSLSPLRKHGDQDRRTTPRYRCYRYQETLLHSEPSICLRVDRTAPQHAAHFFRKMHGHGLAEGRIEDWIEEVLEAKRPPPKAGDALEIRFALRVDNPALEIVGETSDGLESWTWVLRRDAATGVNHRKST